MITRRMVLVDHPFQSLSKKAGGFIKLGEEKERCTWI